MPVQVDEAIYSRAYRPPLYNVRWTAVFAGLAVGIATNMFLLLLGAAMGLAVFSAGAKTNEEGLLLAASLWDTACVLIASFIGGYIAARASGMRRTPDGVMHGLLAWSVAMLVTVLLATSVAGDLLSDFFNEATDRPVAAETVTPFSPDERQAMVEDLETRFGLTSMQANRIVDDIMTMSGRGGPAEEPRADEAAQTLRTAMVVGGWLSVAVLLSLLGAIGGGVLGSRGSRRAVGRDLRRTQEPTADAPRESEF